MNRGNCSSMMRICSSIYQLPCSSNDTTITGFLDYPLCPGWFVSRIFHVEGRLIRWMITADFPRIESEVLVAVLSRVTISNYNEPTILVQVWIPLRPPKSPSSSQATRESSYRMPRRLGRNLFSGLNLDTFAFITRLYTIDGD